MANSIHPTGERNAKFREHLIDAVIWSLGTLLWLGNTAWSVAAHQGVVSVMLSALICLLSVAITISHAVKASKARHAAAQVGEQQQQPNPPFVVTPKPGAADRDVDFYVDAQGNVMDAHTYQRTIIVQLDGKTLARSVVEEMPAVIRLGTGKRGS